MNPRTLKIEEVQELIPDRVKESHKGTYGKVCLLGGAVEYSGAIRLSALAYAALKSGAGLSTVAVPRFLVPIVSANILEVMIYPIDSTEEEIVFSKENIDGLINKFDVLTIGMGLGRSEEATKIVEYIIENYTGKLVLDADALYIVSKNINILNNSNAKIILTPHMMEFKRLYDSFKLASESIGEDDIRSSGLGLCEQRFKGEALDIEAKHSELDFNIFEKYSLKYAMEFIKTYNVVLLLKGPTTYVLNNNKKSCENDSIRISAIDRGTPGMATAGSGDVLSGIITGFLGYIEDEFDAVRVSAYVNGIAGELAARDEGEISMTSGDTIKHISESIKLIKHENV